jgi:pimeloyl-ACP methyl ester carboxylesterase
MPHPPLPRVLIMRVDIPVIGFLIIFLILAGCTGTPLKSTYSVDNNGVLTLSCAPETTTEEVLFANETYTKSRIVFHTGNGDVVSYLGAPEQPMAVMVYAPGAGEKLAGHEERMVRFASAGYAFLFVDTRGNGGETTGIPFNQQLVQQDYAKFVKGEMPQYYLSVCDLVSAQKLLSARYDVPVYAIGSSNGGRYAAVAAGTDPAFAGYVGISTSDWGLQNSLIQQGVTGDPLPLRLSQVPIWQGSPRVRSGSSMRKRIRSSRLRAGSSSSGKPGNQKHSLNFPVTMGSILMWTSGSLSNGRNFMATADE